MCDFIQQVLVPTVYKGILLLSLGLLTLEAHKAMKKLPLRQILLKQNTMRKRLCGKTRSSTQISLMEEHNTSERMLSYGALINHQH
ncbi:CLUMA_CG009679, isoform A [Clunio marinus]|uniref:CLUMA_CG009679, isoform A n=1 Tax=Clunio marinus TaxID=568069 RepID=A0A1J1I7J1_9DIPT|nr:CLUMA_CG009679, isoform A [Clunio marinus]